MSLGQVFLGVNYVKLGIEKKHRNLLKNQEKFRDFSREIVINRMKQLEKERVNTDANSGRNMLELFFDLKKQDIENNMSEDEIIDEFTIFVIAGMDTTGHLITMASYYLLKSPEIRHKMLEEIDKFFDEPSKITLENLNSLEYTNAVLKETLRMATPAAVVFDREAIVDHEIGGIKIKKGTLINSNFIGANFDSRYHEEPTKFVPERWLDPNSLTNQSIASNPMIFTPFSVGGRNCIGQHIAMMEGKIILGMFLKMFNYDVTDPKYKLNMDMKFLYEPKDTIFYDLESKC